MAWYGARSNYRRRYSGYGRRSNYYRPRVVYRTRYVRSSGTSRRRSTSTAAPQQKPLSQYALAQINPWDPSCRGVKIPDSNTTPSSSFIDTSEFALTSSLTNGNPKCYAFQSHPDCVRVIANDGATSSTWAWAAGFLDYEISPNKTRIENNIGLLRTVAHSVKISSGFAPTGATGFVHIAVGPVSQFGSTTWNFPGSVAALTELPYYRRVTIASLTQNPLIINNKCLDVTGQRYVSPAQLRGGNVGATAGEFQVANQWNTIFVCVDGAGTNTVPLTCECISHYEAIPSSSGIMSTTAALPMDMADMSGVAYMTSNTPATHSPGTPSEQSVVAEATQHYNEGIISQVSSAFTRGARAAVRSGVRRAARAAEYAGRAAVNTAVGAAASYAFGGLPGVTNASRLADSGRVTILN